MISYEESLVYRADCVRQFAKNHPELCNQSGVAFWPVPTIMPLIFARCIYLLELDIFARGSQSNGEAVKNLINIRNLLVRLAAEGDLGQDHVTPYRSDHPCLPAVSNESYFLPHYKDVLRLDSAFMMLGFLYCIEVGSLEFVKALIDTGLIKKDGEFAKLHLNLEQEHHDIAILIEKMILDKNFSTRETNGFIMGCDIHDLAYQRIAES